MNTTLSCEQCHQRKRKCDKTNPCGACRKSGIACTSVQRRRLPRGRTGATKNVNDNLKNRVDKLESIVAKLQETKPAFIYSATAGSDHVTESVFNQAAAVVDRTPTAKRLISEEFWQQLTDTVSGLREALSETDGDENLTTDVYPANMPSPDSLLLGGESVGKHRRFLIHPDLKAQLLQVYRKNVDAIFKVLHWPTVLSVIDSVAMLADDIKPCAEIRCLEYAIYFTAICTLRNDQLQDREELLLNCRMAAEAALVRVGVLSTMNLIVLQAFVVYLAGLRACQATAQMWTLVACAVRIANAQGVPSIAASHQRSFDAEIRRRIWFAIGLLDMQSAFDRGSRPLLSWHDLQVLPLNVNDRDLSIVPGTNTEAMSEHQYTEMTFTLMTCKAIVCQHKLSEGNASVVSSECSTGSRNPLTEKTETLQDFDNCATNLARDFADNPTSIQKFAIAVSRESLAAMQLLLRRPLNKCQSNDFPSGNSFNVLLKGTEVLERSLMKRTSNEFAHWAWYAWVKWYALAVVLAELCGHDSASSQDSERAWKAAEESYVNYAKAVADTESGLLWKPIEKLMHIARKARKNADDSNSHQCYRDTDAQSVTPADFDVMYQAEVEAWTNWNLFVDDMYDPSISYSGE